MEFPNRTEPEWMYENIVWVDPCYSIQPGSKKQWEKMQQALNSLYCLCKHTHALGQRALPRWFSCW